MAPAGPIPVNDVWNRQCYGSDEVVTLVPSLTIKGNFWCGFVQHSGLHVSNPGQVVFMEGGETLVQWRKAFLLLCGVRMVAIISIAWFGYFDVLLSMFQSAFTLNSEGNCGYAHTKCGWAAGEGSGRQHGLGVAGCWPCGGRAREV